jgi:hypothetical protein
VIFRLSPTGGGTVRPISHSEEKGSAFAAGLCIVPEVTSPTQRVMEWREVFALL